MLLSLSGTAIRTISVGVNSSYDGMSEKHCLLYLHWASFITHTSVRLILMHLPLIRELQESLLPEEGRKPLTTSSTTSPADWLPEVPLTQRETHLWMPLIWLAQLMTTWRDTI